MTTPAPTWPLAVAASSLQFRGRPVPAAAAAATAATVATAQSCRTASMEVATASFCPHFSRRPRSVTDLPRALPRWPTTSRLAEVAARPAQLIT